MTRSHFEEAAFPMSHSFLPAHSELAVQEYLCPNIFLAYVNSAAAAWAMKSVVRWR